MLTVTPEFVTGYLKQAHSSDPDILASRKQELVQKPCRSASRYRDVLVRRRPGALSAAEVAFINELRREIAGLVQT